MRAELLLPCPALCRPTDCSLPGSLANGILQARILGWAAVPSSGGPSWPRDHTSISYVYLHCQLGPLSLVPPGKPLTALEQFNSSYSPHKWQVLFRFIHIFVSNFTYKFLHFIPSVCNYFLSGWSTFVIFSPGKVLLIVNFPSFSLPESDLYCLPSWKLSFPFHRI